MKKLTHSGRLRIYFSIILILISVVISIISFGVVDEIGGCGDGIQTEDGVEMSVEKNLEVDDNSQLSPKKETEGTCGDGICSPAERTNKESCLDDCVKTYNAFESDLKNVLSRTDNVIRPVISQKKAITIERVINFAGKMLGVSIDGVSTQENGRQVRKLLDSKENLRALLAIRLGDPYKNDTETVVARKMWAGQPPVSPLPDRTVTRLASRAKKDYGPSTSRGERALPLPINELHKAAKDESGAVIQSVGYVRSFGTRRVYNSMFTVDVDTATSTLAGISNNNWWPVGASKICFFKKLVSIEGRYS